MTASIKMLHAAQALMVLLLVISAVILVHSGNLATISQLQGLVQSAGVWAPLAFIGLQIIQVTLPIVPGGLSTVAAVAIFGPVWGFVYNYIGISLGSVAAFLLVRHFGKPLVAAVISPKRVAKYAHYLNDGPRFARIFTIAILLPVAPDDLLCLLAGLTTMPLKQFVWIISLCKPWTIIAYSLGMHSLLQLLGSF
ncbi:TVP38/TMEM64 family protein [Lacticaseibacillus baoqingensis]|uniref:TVP38/TMEM64 family membrane protein n=1 Tax=Lacticaseibacillus baoqingensis TaxID=2486013 RepID=A0ABW4EAN4_9LACO|nr:TVP38/TMEM64 family protein [Lacticaseibacillus baoqingensis]